jgi:sugar-specific transcriptional regulator TrmB
METTINLLMKLNFSRNEAVVYYYLLENPGMTVYQIAKDLNLSRSSIYPIVEKLYLEGVLLLENKDKDLYYAEDPSALLKNLSVGYEENIKTAKKALKQVFKKAERETYLNFVSYNAMIAKAKTMLLSAQKEVYINTDLDCQVFDDEFKVLEENKVRVIYFSFKKSTYKRSNVEIYSHGYEFSEPNRLMLVVDYEFVLVGNINLLRDEWLGTFTNNPLMVRIISEHIHHDIYLLKIEQKLGTNLFEMHPDIFLGTINEKGINDGEETNKN